MKTPAGLGELPSKRLRNEMTKDGKPNNCDCKCHPTEMAGTGVTEAKACCNGFHCSWTCSCCAVMQAENRDRVKAEKALEAANLQIEQYKRLINDGGACCNCENDSYGITVKKCEPCTERDGLKLQVGELKAEVERLNGPCQHDLSAMQNKVERCGEPYWKVVCSKPKGHDGCHAGAEPVEVKSVEWGTSEKLVEASPKIRDVDTRKCGSCQHEMREHVAGRIDFCACCNYWGSRGTEKRDCSCEDFAPFVTDALVGTQCSKCGGVFKKKLEPCTCSSYSGIETCPTHGPKSAKKSGDYCQTCNYPVASCMCAKQRKAREDARPSEKRVCEKCGAEGCMDAHDSRFGLDPNQRVL